MEWMDRILAESDLENEFIHLAAAERGFDLAGASAKRARMFARYSTLALRANIAGKLMELPSREFCARLADSHLLQWFLGIGAVDAIRPFSKSTKDRLGKWVGAGTMAAVNAKFTALLAGTGGPVLAEQIGLPGPVDFSEVFFDSTCLKANIHFPVDWVLLRDATRTLMKAVVLVRAAGLKVRMPQEPLEFLSDMNSFCMAMTAKWRSSGGKQQRKKVLRGMKRLAKRVAAHAQSHLDLLKAKRGESSLSEKQAAVIIARLEGVLKQLPAAIKQAHERIIGGRKVANEDKILSLYDGDVNVVVRGKANAEVEFGNRLWLGETRDGLIVDYKLCRDTPTDTRLVEPAIQRMVDEQKLPVAAVWGDRGLHSGKNEAMLEARGIKSGLCPRSPGELARRLADEPGFREGLKRRGSTEARVGIFTNVFMGRPCRAKGFGHREMEVGWAVLAHNLWVISRLAEEEKKRRQQAERQALDAARRRAA